VAHNLLNFLNWKQSIILGFHVPEEHICACILFVNCSFEGSECDDGYEAAVCVAKDIRLKIVI
jgi:hypothetical protein